MIKKIIIPICFFSSTSMALQPMEESALSDVIGFAGLTVETKNEGVDIGEVKYREDGTELSVKNVSLMALPGQNSFDSKTTYDVTQDGALAMHTVAQNRDFTIGSVGLSGSNKSFGEFRGRYNYETRLRFLPKSDGSFETTGSELALNIDRLYFRDNGLDLIVDDFSVITKVLDGRLEFVDDKLILQLGDSTDRGMNFVYSVGAVGLDATHSSVSTIGYTTPLTQTFGSLDLNFDAYGSIAIKSGGASGEGITFIPALTLINDDPDQFGFRYRDDGNLILAKSFSGTFSTTSGFTIDLEQASASDPYMAIRFSDFDFAFNLEDAVLGGNRS